MTEIKPIRYVFAKIITEEFAITGESFNPAEQSTMNLNMSFGLDKQEKVLAMKVKCMFYQHEKLIELIHVGCFFRIVPEDWESLYNSEKNVFVMPHLTALFFAGLAISTARGVLHGLTVNQPVNALIIPPVNVAELIKGDLILSGTELSPTP